MPNQKVESFSYHFDALGGTPHKRVDIWLPPVFDPERPERCLWGMVDWKSSHSVSVCPEADMGIVSLYSGDRQQNNKVLHKLFGKCWHEPHRPNLWEYYRCRHCKREYSDEEIAYAEYGNPDYAADPRLVLEGMRERGILGAFCDYLEMHGDFPYEEIIHESFSLVLDRTGVLGDLAIDFLKEQEGE